MSLQDFPRPPGDTGRGVHWTAGLHNPIDTWLDHLVAMGFSWCKILSDVQGSGLRNAELLLSRGIMPIVRLYKHKAYPDGFDDWELEIVREFVRRGVCYFSTHNEGNLQDEWAYSFWEVGAAGRVEVVGREFVRDARRVIDMGGIISTPPLAPGGNHDDMHMFSDLLRWLFNHGHAGALLSGKVAIGCHNYTLNHPVMYLKDSNGFLKFRFYHHTLRARLADAGLNPNLADEIPILSLEGGTQVGASHDGNYPTVTEEMHRDWTVQQCSYMETAEPYYFCTAFWLLANYRAGHDNEKWESQAWFSDRWPGGQLPAVDALKALPRRERGLPVAYKVGEGFKKAESLVGPWDQDEIYHWPETEDETSMAVGKAGYATWRKKTNETVAHCDDGRIFSDFGNRGDGQLKRMR